MDIVLADDHALVREGVTPFLTRLSDDVSVLEAGSLQEALQQAKRAQALGLIILDLYMPGMNGFNGIKAMRQAFPKTPLAVMSGFTTEEEAMGAISSGANGFLPKTMSAVALTGALQIVMAGDRYFPSFLFSKESRQSGRLDPLEGLSPREQEVARYVAEGAPNKVIARHLDLHEVTVKAHLRRVFKKLGVSNRTEVAKIVHLQKLRPTGAIAN